MKFCNAAAECFVPDGKTPEQALERTTHLAFGAHQDDIEILAFHGVLQCIYSRDRWFTAVVCTDGAGSPRAGAYADYTNEQMQETRWAEQRKAATVGRYSAAIQLKYPSSAVKDPANRDVLKDLSAIVQAARPTVVYMHNPADKHDTHLGVTVKALAALRALPRNARPEKVYGVEVWRGLDWMQDADKIALDVSGAAHLAAALLGVYDSQIAGGKRYDLATLGRWRANATYFESHGVDTAQHCIFAMDLAPLMKDDTLDVADYTLSYISKFRDDVKGRLEKFRPK